MQRIAVLSLLGMLIGLTGCQSSQALFNGKDLTGWVELGSQDAWSVEDGVLLCSGEKTGYAWLCTQEKYGDFELTLDWKISEGGNAGVFLRVPKREGRASMEGFEVQIRDDAQDENLSDVSGAIFRRVNARGIYSKPAGQWNTYRITCLNRQVRVVLNGQLAAKADMDQVEPLDQDPPMADVPDEGFIGLQNHGDRVSFRNISIRKLCPMLN